MPIAPQASLAPQGAAISASGQQSIDTTRARANITVGIAAWEWLAHLLRTDIDNPLSYDGVCDEGKGDFFLIFHGLDLWNGSYWNPSHPILRAIRQRILNEIVLIEYHTDLNAVHLEHIHAAFQLQHWELQHTTLVGGKPSAFLDELIRSEASDEKFPDLTDAMVVRTNRRDGRFMPAAVETARRLRQEADATTPIGLRHFRSSSRGVPEAVARAVGIASGGGRGGAPPLAGFVRGSAPGAPPGQFMRGAAPPPAPGHARHSLIARTPNEVLPDAVDANGDARSVWDMARDETVSADEEDEGSRPRGPRPRRGLTLLPGRPGAEENVVSAGDEEEPPTQSPRRSRPVPQEGPASQTEGEDEEEEEEEEAAEEEPPEAEAVNPEAEAAMDRLDVPDAPAEEDEEGAGAADEEAGNEEEEAPPEQGTPEEEQEPVPEEGQEAQDDGEAASEPADAPEPEQEPPPEAEEPPPAAGGTDDLPSRDDIQQMLAQDAVEHHVAAPEEATPTPPSPPKKTKGKKRGG